MEQVAAVIGILAMLGVCWWRSSARDQQPTMTLKVMVQPTSWQGRLLVTNGYSAVANMGPRHINSATLESMIFCTCA